MKAGFRSRRLGGITYVNSQSEFTFPAALTATTFNNPPATQGDQFATMLLGAHDNSSNAYGGPAPTPYNQSVRHVYSGRLEVNSKLTINIGLRNEYETAISDPNHLL